MSRTADRVGTGGRSYKNRLARERNKRKRAKKAQAKDLPSVESFNKGK